MDGYIDIPPVGSASWKDPVDTAANLPASGNSQGDARVTKDTNTIYIWDGSAWVPVSGGGGGANQYLSNLLSPTAVNQFLNMDQGASAKDGSGSPFIATQPADVLTKQYLDYYIQNPFFFPNLIPYTSKPIGGIGGPTKDLVSLPQAFYKNLPFIKVIQNNVELVEGTDYVLENSESALAAERQLYINGVNNPADFPFFDRVCLLNGNTVDPVSVEITEKFLPHAQYTLGLNLWNFDSNTPLSVDTNSTNGSTFASLRVPRIINAVYGPPPQYYLIQNISGSLPNMPPYIDVNPFNDTLSQTLKYNNGITDVTVDRKLHNMAFIRELPLDYNFYGNAQVVEVWCIHRNKWPKPTMTSPLSRRRQRLTPYAIYDQNNVFNLKNLILYPDGGAGSYFSRRVRKARNLIFRIRNTTTNSVTPWVQGKIHVCTQKQIVVQGIRIKNLYEVYLI